MVDTRFHRPRGTSSLRALLAAVESALEPDDPRADELTIGGVEELALASANHLALAAHRSYASELANTRAGAVIVAHALLDAVPPHAIAVPVERPHELFATVLDTLYPASRRMALMSDMDEEERARLLEDDIVIGANVVLGPGVEIGRGTIIGPGTVIGSGVAIGRNCVIGASCTVDCAYLGDDVVLHPGVRIGTEGFGWLDHGRSNRKVPQLGRVIVQDRVEIGANSTIDRGALGDTVIGEGTKIDNLVQIGHNCRIGRNCLIAATSGLSGSTILGDGILMGGGVGTSGHLSIGSNTIVYGRAAVTKSWPENSRLGGTPAQEMKGWLRDLAIVRRLSRGEKNE